MTRFQDRLTVVGLLVGVFVLVVGLGTLLGQPWQYAAGGAPVMVLQLLGALGALVIGGFLLSLSRVGA
ncbi:MAG: hypothetical protein ACQEQJ_06080 [Halobacteriota archaeon]|uniref:hypothetical protein n=1 Tax=Halodesulfurarchaeum sp. HSR-GB TaxID=3074077 RepID=UPI002855BC15|nr:hypothetical protein [Halodesulfurarchaeum sp. HSR-GB]MDR5656577.1 hypothetical protein [Halodesulfurarchaeum sp. HSR-GB]